MMKISLKFFGLHVFFQLRRVRADRRNIAEGDYAILGVAQD